MRRQGVAEAFIGRQTGQGHFLRISGGCVKYEKNHSYMSHTFGIVSRLQTRSVLFIE